MSIGQTRSANDSLRLYVNGAAVRDLTPAVSKIPLEKSAHLAQMSAQITQSIPPEYSLNSFVPLAENEEEP
jgi:hypothetical protein